MAICNVKACIGQSLSRMAGACGPLAPPGVAQPFSSPCPPRSRPIRNSPLAVATKDPVKEKENLSLAAVYECASVTSACDELDISRLSPAACVVGLRIDLRSRKSPFQFRPPSPSLRWAGLPLELSRRTDGHALPQETTAYCRRTSEQCYWHTLRGQPELVLRVGGPRHCRRSHLVRPPGTREPPRIHSGWMTEAMSRSKLSTTLAEKYSQASGGLVTRSVNLPTATLWQSIPKAMSMWPRPIGAAESKNLSQ